MPRKLVQPNKLGQEGINQLPGATAWGLQPSVTAPLPTTASLMSHGLEPRHRMKIIIINVTSTDNNKHSLSTQYFPDTRLIASQIFSYFIFSTISCKGSTVCKSQICKLRHGWVAMNFLQPCCSWAAKGNGRPTRGSLNPEPQAHLRRGGG